MTRWVERACWWNGHLAMERASCCGMGILLWNWHLASFNISSGGQDARSTPIHSEIQ
ncbi:hypothetical protein [Moorena producens]|uniref:hypothetical protein n=1 Tax=Moorena producens TaxID=1155739 RepID=UPI003C74D1C0